MRFKLFKILVVCSTSIILMFTLINSKASVVNNNFGSYILDDASYDFKDYSSITTFNDLKGTFWILGFDGYEMYEHYSDELYGIKINYNSYSDARRIPFVLQPRSSFCIENYGYIYNPNAVLSFLSLKSSTSLYFSSLTTYPYLGLELFNISYDNGIIQTGSSFQTMNFMYDKDNEMQYIYDISFANSPNDLTNCVGFPITIICFPNSDEYTLSFTSSNPNSTESLALNMFKNYCTQITPSSFDNLLGQFEYSKGYDVGYKDGVLNSSNEGYRFTFLTGIFNAVSDLLSIEIFPNVQLGYFVFIPLALGITGMIFWFWRKD